MNSEKIDWISECGVGRRKGVALSDIFKSVFLKKIGITRGGKNQDPIDLIAKHNLVFGIDSNLPDAAMRYDLRKVPPVSSVELPKEAEVRFTPTPRIRTVSVQPVIQSVVSITDSVPTSDGDVASVSPESFSTDAKIDVKEYIAETDASDEGSETEYFPGIGASVAEEQNQMKTDSIRIDVEEDAEELTDVAAEDIAGYVEAEIARELKQTTIDNPIFEASEGRETPDPVFTRQERLDITYEESVLGSEEGIREIEGIESVVESATPSIEGAIASAAAVADALSAMVDSAVVSDDEVTTEGSVGESVEAIAPIMELPATEKAIELPAAKPLSALPAAEVVASLPAAADVPALPVPDAVQEIASEQVESVEDVQIPVVPVEKAVPARSSSGISFGFGRPSVAATGTGIRFSFGIAAE